MATLDNKASIQVAFFNIMNAQLTVIKRLNDEGWRKKRNNHIWIFCHYKNKESAYAYNPQEKDKFSEEEICAAIKNWIGDYIESIDFFLIDEETQVNFLEFLSTPENSNQITNKLWQEINSRIFKEVKTIYVYHTKKIYPSSFIINIKFIELESQYCDGVHVHLLNLPQFNAKKETYLLVKIVFGNLSLLLGKGGIEKYYNGQTLAQKNFLHSTIFDFFNDDSPSLYNQDISKKDLVLDYKKNLTEVNPDYIINSLEQPTYNKKVNTGRLLETSAQYFIDKYKIPGENNSQTKYHFLTNYTNIQYTSLFKSITTKEAFGMVAIYKHDGIGYTLSLTNQPVFQTNAQGTIVFSWDTSSTHPEINTFRYTKRWITSVTDLQSNKNFSFFEEKSFSKKVDEFLENQNVILNTFPPNSFWSSTPKYSQKNSILYLLETIYSLRDDINGYIYFMTGVPFSSRSNLDKELSKAIEEIKTTVNEIKKLYDKAINIAVTAGNTVSSYQDVKKLLQDNSTSSNLLLSQIRTVEHKGLECLNDFLTLLEKFTALKFPDTGVKVGESLSRGDFSATEQTAVTLMILGGGSISGGAVINSVVYAMSAATASFKIATATTLFLSTASTIASGLIIGGGIAVLAGITLYALYKYTHRAVVDQQTIIDTVAIFSNNLTLFQLTLVSAIHDLLQASDLFKNIDKLSLLKMLVKTYITIKEKLRENNADDDEEEDEETEYELVEVIYNFQTEICLGIEEPWEENDGDLIIDPSQFIAKA